jgi:acyl dehydratase
MDRYLDDFNVGERFESRSITVSAEEIVAFAGQFDPQ